MKDDEKFIAELIQQIESMDKTLAEIYENLYRMDECMKGNHGWETWCITPNPGQKYPLETPKKMVDRILQGPWAEPQTKNDEGPS